MSSVTVSGSSSQAVAVAATHARAASANETNKSAPDARNDRDGDDGGQSKPLSTVNNAGELIGTLLNVKA